MSRSYRVSLTETVREHVKVEDGVKTQLEVLPVLDKESTAELLADALTARGFERDGDVMRRVDTVNGAEIEISVDVSTGEVSVRAAQEKAVEKQKTAERYFDEDFDHAEQEARARQALQSDLKRAVDSAEGALSDELTSTLESALRDLQGELDGAVTEVTRESLKRKAASIGEIEEVSETKDGMTIKVKV